MKAAIVLTFLTLTFSAVDAAPRDTNARRLARGLPPLAPKRRQPGAKRNQASSTPFHCDTKKTFCCSRYESSSSPAASSILSGLGIHSSSCGEKIGTGCVAISGDSCSSGTTPATCCGNIVGSELVGIDCTPITISTSSSHPASSSSSVPRSSSSAAHSSSAHSSSSAVHSSSASASASHPSSASSHASSSASASASHASSVHSSSASPSSSAPHSSSARSSSASASRSSSASSHASSSASAVIRFARKQRSQQLRVGVIGAALVVRALEQRPQLFVVGVCFALQLCCLALKQLRISVVCFARKQRSQQLRVVVLGAALVVRALEQCRKLFVGVCSALFLLARKHSSVPHSSSAHSSSATSSSSASASRSSSASHATPRRLTPRLHTQAAPRALLRRRLRVSAPPPM
ncbi:hypothetical protein B0H11DRAFT_188225 [Mycena galericulata]|nr:hypothetical protein B0H11DRAFT_188225 [Mycena galericulata]